MRSRLLIAVAVLALLCVDQAVAIPITYTVVDDPLLLGSVTGTIETDGTV